MAACEVVDAMTHDRGYREALPVKEALAEIGEWAPGEVVKAVEAAWLELRVEKLDRELAGLAGVRVFYG